MRFLTAIIVAVATAGTANAEMTISYHWNKECVDGKSPPIAFSGVPEGTVKFDIVGDAANAGEFFRGLARPDYARREMPHGTFQYNFPCPPFSSRFYRWTAKALDAKGKTLSIARKEKLPLPSSRGGHKRPSPPY